MGKVYRKQRIEGVTVPAIIHNGSYFWEAMAVYEDGTISCWEKVDLCGVPRKLERGWLSVSVPAEKCLSVFHCCSLEMSNAKWNFDNESYYKFIEDTVRLMNPEMENIYKTTPREEAFWKERRICFSGSPTFCKADGKRFGYELLDGEDSHIFLRRDGKTFLTLLCAYSDGTFSIDGLNAALTLEEIEVMFSDNTISAAPRDGERVYFGANGEFGEADCKATSKVKKKAKLDEIRNNSLKAQGKPDAHEACMKAYYAYLVEPTEFYKDRLRKAYEAVPEHERCYLGDMDTRDSDFRRILYSNRKREV